MCKITIVIDDEELQETFSDYIFPFYLKKAIKELKKHEGVKYLADEIAGIIKQNPELQGIAKLTDRKIKTCGVYKMRVKKENNRGKSNGYRVVFLLVTPLNKGFVLDITDHNIIDDLTNEQKEFCNTLVRGIDEALKEAKV